MPTVNKWLHEVKSHVNTASQYVEVGCSPLGRCDQPSSPLGRCDHAPTIEFSILPTLLSAKSKTRSKMRIHNKKREYNSSSGDLMSRCYRMKPRGVTISVEAFSSTVAFAMHSFTYVTLCICHTLIHCKSVTMQERRWDACNSVSLPKVFLSLSKHQKGRLEVICLSVCHSL